MDKVDLPSLPPEASSSMTSQPELPQQQQQQQQPAAFVAIPAATDVPSGVPPPAAEELDFDSYNDAALVKLLGDLEKRNGFYELENQLFTSYLNRVSPNALRSEDDGEDRAAGAMRGGAEGAGGGRMTEKESRGKKKKGEKGKEQEKPIMLAPEQKSEIATRELEELRDEIEKQKLEWERRLDNLKAEMEEMDLRNAEIRKLMYEFRRDIVQGAVNPRTGKVTAERVVRYFEDSIRSKDHTMEKVRLKNTALRVQKTKLALQLKQKEEMGEVLHAIDFDQLTIENQNYQMKIEERNSELLKLKLTAGNSIQVLNQYKKRLPLLTSEATRLKAEIDSRSQLLARLKEESAVAEAERAKAARASQAIKEQLTEYRVPSVMDYVEYKAKREEAARRLASWERKVEIAEMALQRVKKIGKQISKNPQSYRVSPSSMPHHLAPIGCEFVGQHPARQGSERSPSVKSHDRHGPVVPSPAGTPTGLQTAC